MSIILDSFQQQKILSGQDLLNAQEEYRSLDRRGNEELWSALHEYFIKAPVSADRKFWYSYFRWYTHLTWANLLSCSEEIVSSIAFPRQIVMAVLLQFDPIAELVEYLNAKPFDEESMVVFYTKLRDGVLKSGAVVGVAKGREVTGADLVRELTVINQNKDTLRLAEFAARLQEVLLPKADDEFLKFIPSSRDDAAASYLSAISFFIGVTPEAIWAMVKTAFHPELFDGQLAASAEIQPASDAKFASQNVASAPQTPAPLPKMSSVEPVAMPKSTETQNATRPPSTMRDVVNSVGNVQQPVAANSPEKKIVVNRPGNKEIRGMVEALFPPQEGSDDERLPKILSLLETLSVRYGDETISDLYYFNSERSRFEWLE